MKSAKESGNFPYNLSTVCYFEVDKKGNTTEISHKNKSDRQGVFEAYKRAVKKDTTLHAVWPGIGEATYL